MTGSEYAYRLEPARGSDAERLAAMSRAHVEAGLKPAWGAARIRWHVRDAESVVLTARLPAMVAGFAIMRYGEDVAHLNLLAVDPAHRRRGIARALVRWLEETALTAGTFVIGLELRAGDAPAAVSGIDREQVEVGDILSITHDRKACDHRRQARGEHDAVCVPHVPADARGSPRRPEARLDVRP